MSGPSYIDHYAEALGHGRGIMRVDVVIDGRLVDTHTEGSPAPLATVQAAAHRCTLSWRMRP
jgi:hypothetical protein